MADVSVQVFDIWPGAAQLVADHCTHATSWALAWSADGHTLTVGGKERIMPWCISPTEAFLHLHAAGAGDAVTAFAAGADATKVTADYGDGDNDSNGSSIDESGNGDVGYNPTHGAGAFVKDPSTSSSQPGLAGILSPSRRLASRTSWVSMPAMMAMMHRTEKSEAWANSMCAIKQRILHWM